MDVLQYPWLQDPRYLSAIASGIVALILFFIWLRYRSKHRYERQLRKQVKKLAVDFKRDVYLPDGLGESVFIEYLVLSHYGILVLNVQNYPGILFGGDNVDLWTQVDNHKSYKFDNPLPYNEICITAVKQLAPGCQINGQVVFTHAGEFPKGKPDGVSLTSELSQYVESLEHLNVIPDSLQTAWESICLIANHSGERNSVLTENASLSTRH